VHTREDYVRADDLRPGRGEWPSRPE
jgi:hypothetical protein